MQDNQLSQLSKDFDAVDVRAAEFLISGGSLLMAAADAGGTLRLFSYDQKSPASARGTRLLPLCVPSCPPPSAPLPSHVQEICRGESQAPPPSCQATPALHQLPTCPDGKQILM